MKLPHMRFTVPIVIPLFVLEDILESVSVVIRVVGFLLPSSRGKIERSIGELREFIPCNEELDITVLLDAGYELIRGLRSYGRFTLVEVSEGSSGVRIAVRFV